MSDLIECWYFITLRHIKNGINVWNRYGNVRINLQDNNQIN